MSTVELARLPAPPVAARVRSPCLADRTGAAGIGSGDRERWSLEAS